MQHALNIEEEGNISLASLMLLLRVQGGRGPHSIINYDLEEEEEEEDAYDAAHIPFNSLLLSIRNPLGIECNLI
jgi:hypothetical protein